MRTDLIAGKLTQACLSVLLFACFGARVEAQSTDSATPSPVRLNEVTGTISARDIGDARLTDHYYALIGTPGDLLVTLETKNLNGDIDIFSASGLRPLLKFTIYADSSALITKSIYFRKREDLIVRIEARTPNDDPGTYRLYFGGSFEPITSGPLLAENANPPVELSTTRETTGKKGRRVTSAGARINEPEPPAEVATEPATSIETAEPIPADPPPRRGRKGAPRRRPPARAAETAGDVAKADESPVSEKPAEQPTEQPATKPGDEQPRETSGGTASSRRAAARRSASAARRARPQPPQEPEPETGPRLVIETSDGTLIDRSMSTVRRVTVENGQVVVVGKDGKINRIQLGDVVRMSISP